MTMKLIAVSLTLKLLLSCPPFLVCPPSLSWTARSRLLILSMRPLICPWSIPCHFLIRMRRKPLESGVRLYGLVHFLLLLQKSPSDGHSLAGRPHFPELGSDSTIYWPSLVTFSPDELQLASTYRLLSNQRSVLFPVWSFEPSFLLSWNTFPCLTIVVCLPSLTPLLGYWQLLVSMFIATDLSKTRPKKIIYKRRAKETPILLVTIQRFSLNRGFCNFWNSTLSHSSAQTTS